ncbi:MAG: serine hydrolase [Anaerolineaceae bacterium]|nr:serine hydrolase [Anaerolineaceae bacterium]
MNVRKVSARVMVGIVFLTAVFVAGLPVTIAQSSTPDFAAIDAFVESSMKSANLPGLELGIVHGDNVVHLQSFGIADPSGRPVTPQTPFMVASLTKSFTAVAIMQLVEAGQVELDAPVRRYLPWFRLADDDASTRITLRHLLNHTSGISRLTGVRFLPVDNPRVLSPETYVRGLSDVKLSHPVGEVPEYSNANYAILGLVVEAVSGISYEQYLNENIFTPLAMTNTFLSEQEARQHGMATGYQMRFDQPFPVDLPFPYAIEAAGGIISTAEDISHYLIPYLNKGKYGANVLLSPDSIAQLWQAPTYIPRDEHSNYALGWTTDVPYEISGNDHSGSSGSFHSHMAVSSDNGWGVVILTNADHLLLMTQPIESMTWKVMGMLVNQPVQDNVPFTRILFWLTFLIVAIQLVTLIRGAFRLRRWNRNLESRPHGLGQVLVRIILPVVLNLLVAYIFLVGLPQFAGLRFETLLVYIPDWGLGFVLGGLLAAGWMGWGIVGIVILLRSSSSHAVGGVLQAA